MAEGTAEGDAELADPGSGLEEDPGAFKRDSLKESCHSDSLLAPDADSMTDGRSSVASNLDVADRLTYLEQRMQMQEDEIQLLKMTLADVLKRLNIYEEHQAINASASGRRTSGIKGRPVSMGLPPRAPLGISGVASLRKSSTLPSGATCRNYSPTPPRCSVRSPAGSVKDSPCKTSKTRPSSSASSCASTQEGSSRSKEGPSSLGMRRVTHSKDLSEPPRKKDWVF